MPEIIRTRDVVVHFKGDAYTVRLSDDLVASGWPGGMGVMWADSDRDEFMVQASDGAYGGFLLWGSDESSDQLTSTFQNQTTHRYAVLCAGGWLMSTATYEKYTYASRQAGPLVAITYIPGQSLYFSLRGYWTSEDEWTASGDPRAPNYFAVGRVVAPPSAVTSYYIVLQTSI